MVRFIIKRLLWMIPTLLGVLFIIFTINYFTPGDPAQLSLGSDYTEEAYQTARENMGLDKPVLVRYAIYVKGIVTKFDFGTSYDTKRPVKDMIAGRIGRTLALGGLSALVTIVVGVSIGILSAVKQYSPVDYLATALAVIFSAAPGFWVGLMAIILFSLKLHWLPAAGLGTWKHFVLPVICMGLSPMSIVVRMTRTSMLDVIRQDYIRTARAKGVAERTVIFRHALRNALIPVITIIGMQLTMMFGGSFIIESIFSIPGMGMLMLTSINNLDYPTTQGIVFLLSTCVCVINLLVDLAYAVVDPRMKSQFSSGRKPRRAAKKEAA